MKSYLIIIISLLVISPSISFTQKKEVSLDIGYGLNTITYRFSNVGLTYRYTPKNAPFSIKTGVSFDCFKNTNSTLNFGRIPFGLDFNIGKKVQLILGLGFNSSFLIYSKTDIENFNSTRNSIQLGIYTNLGICIPLKPKLSLLLLSQYHQDFTPLYSKIVYSHVGSSNLEGVFSQSFLFSLGVKYNID